MLRAHGLTLERTFALADHARFDSAELPPAADGLLLCTEKDAVKLWRYRPGCTFPCG